MLRRRAARPAPDELPSDPVADRGRPDELSAVRAAVELALRLHPVPNDLTPALLADRRHPMDGAFEAVEDVRLTLGSHLDRHVVVVAAHFATRHWSTLPCRHANTEAIARVNPVKPSEGSRSGCSISARVPTAHDARSGRGGD